MAIGIRTTNGAASLVINSWTWDQPVDRAAGDILVLAAGWKPYTSDIASTPSGFTLLQNVVSGTTPSASDVGSSRAVLFSKLAGASNPNPTQTLTTHPTPAMHGSTAFFSNAGKALSIASAKGFSTATGNSLDVTGDAPISWAVGDWGVVCAFFRSDQSTPLGSANLTAAGITFALRTARFSPIITTVGDDAAFVMYTYPVTAGAATVAPRFTANVAGVGNALDATVLFYRIHEVTAAPTGPAVSVWNGTVEVAAAFSVWNGTTEVAATPEVVS